MDFQTFLAVIGAVAAIVTIVGGIYKVWVIGLRGFLESLKFRLARAYWKVPKKTLIVLALPAGPERTTLSWSMGRSGVGEGKPGMQVVGDFYFTNISSEAVLVTKAFLVAYYRKWGLIPFSRLAEGYVFVEHAEGGIHGRYEIPSRWTTEGRADWWIEPPIKKEWQNLLAQACFIDQFDNKHWTPALTWRYIK